jgi:hypothetical protein
MAKITTTQRWRLIASSIALVTMAATMMPTTTNASSGGDIGVLGFTPPSVNSSPGIPSLPHQLSHRNAASRHSHVIGSPFFSLGVDGVWIDNSGRTPTVVITHPTVIRQQQLVSSPAVVKTPSAAEQGIIVVRGDNKSYVTFPSG